MKKHSPYRVVAPGILDFSLGKRDEIITFLAKLIKARKGDVLIDVSYTIYISEGGFLALRAQVEKAVHSEPGRRFTINRPKIRKAREYLKEQFIYAHQNNPDRTVFHVSTAVKKDDVSTNSVTDPEMVDKVVQGLKRIGVTTYFAPFYDFLVELIGNATEHGIRNKNINWWLIHYKEKGSKSIRYVFVDMGTGIVSSYRQARLRFRYWLARDRRIVRDALDGRLGSSTKQANRGKGLPMIKEIVEKGYLSDFMLVSNGVTVVWDKREFVYLKNSNFVGTYYSWSISKDNVQLWENSEL